MGPIGRHLVAAFQFIFPARARARLMGLTLAVVCNTAVMITEMQLIAPGLRGLYVKGKSALIFAMALTGVLIRRKPGRLAHNYAVGFLFFAMPFWCSLFRPLYVVSLFEHLAVYSFSFVVGEWFFIPFAVASFGAFSLTQAFLWKFLPDSTQAISYADFQHLNVQFAIILILFYFFFVRARRFREETERRLSLIGKNASNIAHDLKGMIMGPSLYLNRLLEITGKDAEASVEIKELLDLLNRQFLELGQMMSAFNQLCLVEQSPITRFSAAEVVASAKKILWKHGQSTYISIEGDLIMEGEKAAFLSFCFNVTTNALQAIQGRAGHGFVRWQLCPIKREVSCVDNGGGISAEAMKAIEASAPYSSREHGTGLGVPVICQAARQLGGVVRFENFEDGARVVLTFR